MEASGRKKVGEGPLQAAGGRGQPGARPDPSGILSRTSRPQAVCGEGVLCAFNACYSLSMRCFPGELVVRVPGNGLSRTCLLHISNIPRTAGKGWRADTCQKGYPAQNERPAGLVNSGLCNSNKS